MFRRSILTISTLALFANLVSAQDKPNFSGTWKMDASKSDFGPMPSPSKMERTIDHKDPMLTFKSVQTTDNGEQTSETKYMTDGTDSVNKQRGADVKSVAKWDANKLVVKTKREAQGMEISITETWTLAEGGKVLNIVNNINTPQGDFEIKLVMLAASTASAPAATPAAAAMSGKPNFTGEWKLNIAKSSFGPMPPPTSQTLKIKHTDPEIVSVTDQDGADGKTSVTIKYKTDGTESTNDIRGSKAKSAGKWEGDALVVVTKLDFQGMDITLNNNMKLAADGKTMNTVTKIITPQGEFEQAYLFEKIN